MPTILSLLMTHDFLNINIYIYIYIHIYIYCWANINNNQLGLLIYSQFVLLLIINIIIKYYWIEKATVMNCFDQIFEFLTYQKINFWRWNTVLCLSILRKYIIKTYSRDSRCNGLSLLLFVEILIIASRMFFCE